MPSINEAVKQNQSRVANGGNLVEAVTPAPSVPAPGASAPPIVSPGLPVRGVFTPNQILATDFSEGTQAMRKGANLRSAAFPPSAAPSGIQKVAAVVTTIQQVAAALLLKTNNAKNPDQNVLNILAGTGMTIIVDAAGNVVFTSTASGDGLVHGDPIWAVDPAWPHWYDDFYFGTASVTVGGSGLLGELRWDGIIGSGASFTKTMGYWPHPGQVRMDSGATLTTCSSIFSPGATLADSGSSVNGVFAAGLPLLDYSGWSMRWVFGFPAARVPSTVSFFPLVKTQFYCGLAPLAGTTTNSTWVPNNTNGRPPFFVGLRFDSDPTAPAISDTTFKFEVVSNLNFLNSPRNNTQGTIFDTTIVPKENVYYRFELISTTVGTVTMNLIGDDGSSATHTFSSLPKTTINPSSIDGTHDLVANNGITQFSQGAAAASTSSNMTWAIGSIITITGATNAYFNKTWTIHGDGLGAHWVAYTGDVTNITEANSPSTITGYPGLMPYFAWGNDTEAAPVDKTIFLDFWAFVINPGLTNIVPNSALSRYF